MSKSLRIALGHQARVGKDTFAEHLINTRGGRAVSFAAPLYQITTGVQQFYQQEIKKDAALLQTMGELMRQHLGADVFVNAAVQTIQRIITESPDENIIVTDMRYPNEFARLKQLGFVTIKIVRPDRPIDRDPNHPSEVSLADAEFDYVIVNDGTREEFLQKIDKLLNEFSQ